MTQTKASSPTTLVMRRTFNAPRAKVFEAWSNPEIMQRFMGPGEVDCSHIDMDFRVGGTYRVTMDKPDGERLFVGGVYREIDAPRRIVSTWKWEEDDPALEQDTLLTLEFLERGNATELILTHENLRDAEQRDGHEHGWSAILTQLEEVLQ